MSTRLHELILRDLADRKPWEERQRVFYEMRHHGIRRRNKPHANAADLHYPLADGQVDKLKPFYFAQIWGSESLAAFRAARRQKAELTSAAAGWFHDQMVSNTNFFTESMSAIDNMLTSGNEVVKLRFDPVEKQLQFDAIDPVFFVVPPGTTDLQKADRVCHIIQLSKSAYKRNAAYKQDAALIGRICGAPAEQPSKEDAKYLREGITHASKDDQIVLHEVWEHTEQGWRVETYSPQAPDMPVRETYLCTYRLKSRPFLPFVDFPMEVKDKGYHASRGICERVAGFESYITRTWNEKSDCMGYVNKPIFTHEGETINLDNIKLVPGAVVGRNLQAVKMPEPAISFDVEMANTRAAAEQLTAMPDFGLQKANSGRDSRTATEISAVGNLMGMSTDMRARIFRQRLGVLYGFAWAILLEFKRSDLAYFVADEMNMAPTEALHQDYRVQPDGSPDSWNKPARMARAQQRFQMFKGHPHIKQGPLARSVLEEDDPALVKELYTEPEATAADQQEDQAMELAILEKGFPAQVHPADEDAIHLDVLLGRAEAVLQLGEELPQVAWQRIQQHAGAHVQQLQTRDPKGARAYAQKVERLNRALATLFPPVEQFPGATSAPGQAAVATGGMPR